MVEKRKIINPRKKYLIKKINNFVCNKCKEKKPSEELEIDHKIPLANGGNNNYSNLQCLCINCHISKTKGEWKDGSYEKEDDSINKLTPEEKLIMIKDFLLENKHLNSSEINFLILNDPILSSFNYNTTTISNLLYFIRGKKDKKEEYKWKKQRDLVICGLYSEINSLRKLSSKLKEWNITLSPNQIGFIINGIKDNSKIN